jgi:hypothetical protein
MSDTIQIEEQPTYCRNLRTKKMYIPALCQESDPREETDTAQFWCMKTHTGIGPDNNPVRVRKCSADRSCFENEF